MQVSQGGSSGTYAILRGRDGQKDEGIKLTTGNVSR